MTREDQKQRSMTGTMKRTYNNFSVLENEVECSICNNFGHEVSECRNRFWKTTQKEQTSNAKTWRIKEPQPERCGIAFYAEGQESLWYIDSGCSKHMIGDKEKLESYSALESFLWKRCLCSHKRKRHCSVERRHQGWKCFVC